MPVVDTTNPFSNNEQITSTKLNNIMDNSFFVSGAVVPGQGLQVTAGGQMQIGDGAVTPGKLSNSDFGDFTVSSGVATIDNNAITNTKIEDGAVTNTKIANGSVGFNKLLDNAVGTVKIQDNAITAPKLSGAQTGSAPIYGVRAWVNFNGQANTDIAGTYSRTSSTTVTITATAHGLIAGNAVYLDFTVSTGTAPFDGLYLVNSVTDANTFTVISSTTTTSTGTATLKRKTIRGSGNISNVSDAYSGANPANPPTSNQAIGAGFYVVNFSTAMPDSNLAVSGACNETGVFSASNANRILTGFSYNEKCSFIISISGGGTAIDCLHNSVQIIR
jgi:hypothetical protein